MILATAIVISIKYDNNVLECICYIVKSGYSSWETDFPVIINQRVTKFITISYESFWQEKKNGN